MTSTITSIKTTHKDVLLSAMADNTRRAYHKGWKDFSCYCNKLGIDPINADANIVSNFLIEKATTPTLSTGKPLSMGSVAILQCAINRHFLDCNQQSPTSHPKVTTTMKALKRLRGEPPRQVKALREDQIAKMIEQCGTTLIGLRDSAVLAIGFSAALRRSEICALTTNDIEFLPPNRMEKIGMGGMIITIAKSKTDQAGHGQKIAVPEGKYIKPIHRLKVWLTTAGITDGYVFRTMRRGGYLRGDKMHHSDIPRLVKKYAKTIGLNPSDYAGHSLRAGFVTSAAVHNARLDKIMEVTRHTSPDTVMKYIREANLFSDHAGQYFL